MSYADRGRFGRGRNGFGLSVILSAAPAALFFAASVMRPAEFSEVATLTLLAFTVVAVVIGCVAAAIGLPLTVILESNRLERSWTYPLAGLFLGAGTMVAMWEALGEMRLDEATLFYTALGASSGCLWGVLWWWFERRHAQPGREIEQWSNNG